MDYCLYLISGQILPYFINLIEIKLRTLAELSHLLFHSHLFINDSTDVSNKGKKSPPCLEGWQISINALMMLWDKLHSEHDFRFLLTNRLNQDCVENLFSIIRAKGAQRDNPDAGQFRAAFRQVMVMIPSKGGNCEEDVDKFICILENINK